MQQGAQRETWVADIERRMSCERKVAERQLDDFLHKVVNLPRTGASGHRIFLNRRRLTAAAAQRIDALLAQRFYVEQLAQTGAAPQDELEQLDAQLTPAYTAPTNWVPERLSVYEVDAHSQGFGWKYVASLFSTKALTTTLRHLVEFAPSSLKPVPSYQVEKLDMGDNFSDLSDFFTSWVPSGRATTMGT